MLISPDPDADHVAVLLLQGQRVRRESAIANSHNASNYWGEPNAEFDWCERNYYRSAYVSELINTVTGFLYICVAVVSYALMSANVMTTHVKLNLLFITMIGIGTVMFHCTLQYEHQLVDELPICKYYGWSRLQHDSQC